MKGEERETKKEKGQRQRQDGHKSKTTGHIVMKMFVRTSDSLWNT